mgnify:CR=1 FL=1
MSSITKSLILASSFVSLSDVAISAGDMKLGYGIGGDNSNKGLYVAPENYWYVTGNTNVSSAARFKVGGTSDWLYWNGANLEITGKINANAGAFTGFMMQRGRIIILGDVGINLGDSMYDGTIFIGGKIGSFGSDAVPADLTASDQDWLKRKLKVAEIGEKFDVSKMTKIVAGKKLWNYDNLEPHEKKGAI